MTMADFSKEFVTFGARLRGNGHGHEIIMFNLR